MLRQSISPVWEQSIAQQLVATFPTAVDPVSLHVHLFKAGPGFITPATTLADFTEAAFVGYTIKTVLIAGWLGPAFSENFNAATLFANVTWLSGAVVPPGETILGYFVTDPTDSLLAFSEMFADPVPITVPGQVLDLLCQIPMLMVGSIA